VAGKLGTIYVYQRDQFGNFITSYSQGKLKLRWAWRTNRLYVKILIVIDVDISMAYGGAVVTPTLLPTTNGVYAAAFNITLAGTYTTLITINSGIVQDSPFFAVIYPAP
jgi:hypothetical protein